MTHVRRNITLGSVLVVAGVAASFSSGSAALDRPNIDREQPHCVFPVTQELVQQASARDVAGLVKLGPQATLSTTMNWKGKPTHATFLTDGVTVPARVRSVDKLNCAYRAERTDVRLPGGEIANIVLNVHTIPNYRVHVDASRVRVGGVLQRGTQRFFFLPYDAPIAEQPRPEDLPVTPVSPPTPMGPAGYLGPYDIRVPNGTTFDLRMSVRPHADHTKHFFSDGSFEDYLCLKAEGLSQIRIFDATRDSFNFRRTLPPREGLIWEDGRCTARADRSVDCRLRGTYYKTPVLSSWTARAVQGSTNIEGEGSLEINNDVLRYDLTGSWRF